MGRLGAQGGFQRFHGGKGDAVLADELADGAAKSAPLQRAGQQGEMDVAARFLPGAKGARRRHSS